MGRPRRGVRAGHVRGRRGGPRIAGRDRQHRRGPAPLGVRPRCRTPPPDRTGPTGHLRSRTRRSRPGVGHGPSHHRAGWRGGRTAGGRAGWTRPRRAGRGRRCTCGAPDGCDGRCGCGDVGSDVAADETRRPGSGRPQPRRPGSDRRRAGRGRALRRGIQTHRFGPARPDPSCRTASGPATGQEPRGRHPTGRRTPGCRAPRRIGDRRPRGRPQARRGGRAGRRRPDGRARRGSRPVRGVPRVTVAPIASRPVPTCWLRRPPAPGPDGFSAVRERHVRPPPEPNRPGVAPLHPVGRSDRPAGPIDRRPAPGAGTAPSDSGSGRASPWPWWPCWRSSSARCRRWC